MTEQKANETGEGEFWKFAKILAGHLGQVPASFSTAIRVLIADETKHNGVIRPTTKYQVARLLNIPSFKSMLYFATKDLRENQLEGKKYLTIGIMMNCYRAGDLAALIASFAYYRKCRLLIGMENWSWFDERINKESMLGAQLGTAIPKIGTGTGLLLGTVPYYGAAAMFLKDQAVFKKYRLELKKKNMRRDSALEYEMYGCTAGDVGVFLLSAMGFGTEVGSAFSRAFSPAASLANASDELLYRMQIAYVWLEALLNGQRQPLCPIPGHYYPLSVDMIILEEKMNQVKAGHPSFLTRTKDDLNESSAPELFTKPSSSESEVPEELAHIFSSSEIEQMGEEDFDNLVDHMDVENEQREKSGSAAAADAKELEKMVE